MRIDAHQHFWSLARGDYFWMSPNLGPIYRDFLPHDLKPMLDSHGISATVLVQAAPTIEETEYLLGTADAVPWVAAVVGWVDFEIPDHRRHLERFARHPKFRGVRPMIQDIPDPDWMLMGKIDWAFHAVRDLGLHFEALGFPRHLDNFLKLFSRHPDLPIVVDHCMKPQIRDRAFEPWAGKIAKMAAETNVSIKLSALVTEAGPGWKIEDLKPYADHVLRSFGPERVMWGSDWPVLNLNGDYASWIKAARSLVEPRDHEAVFGLSARKFYRLQ